MRDKGREITDKLKSIADKPKKRKMKKNKKNQFEKNNIIFYNRGIKRSILKIRYRMPIGLGYVISQDGHN